MIADPDMEIAVIFEDQLAEALTYQDTFVFEVAYAEEGEPPDPDVHGRLNAFLEQWLDRIAGEGHVVSLARVENEG